MTALTWDKVGERTYQMGVDRGVLYLKDGSSAVWNGLTSIDEESSVDSKSFYTDGVKYLETKSPGDFSASLKAFTYPEEFERCEGVVSAGSGLFLHDQMPESFGLSYRTLLGNDVDGTDLGYRIHILYNLQAEPDTRSFSSMSDQASATEFGWKLSGTPAAISGHKPTAHVSLKSTDLDSDTLSVIEGVLYGTSHSNPFLPSFLDLLFLIENQHLLLVHDNGDGTWTITGPDDLFELPDSTSFEVSSDEGTYINPTTYTLQTTDA